MKIERGETRIVLLIPCLRIVIKFPIIKLKQAFRDGKVVRKKYPNFFKRWIFGSSESAWATLSSLILRGIYCNWIEFCYYQKTKLQVLAPTYFSFFGLINIQRYADPLDEYNFILKMKTVVKEYAQMHHFSSPENFGKVNQQIVFVDYGNRKFVFIVDTFKDDLLRFLLKEAQDK